VTAAVILLAILCATGLLLRLTHRPDDGKGESTPAPEPRNHGAFCCGKHAVCEKLRPDTDKIVYYDDEELDSFTGRPDTGYSDSEIEQFRDVLLSLLPDDIPGWAHSLELRGINIPAELRDELMIAITEACTATPSTHGT